MSLFNLTLHLLEQVLSQFFNYELNDLRCSDVIVVFTLLNLLMMYKPCICVEVFV